MGSFFMLQLCSCLEIGRLTDGTTASQRNGESGDQMDGKGAPFVALQAKDQSYSHPFNKGRWEFINSSSFLILIGLEALVSTSSHPWWFHYTASQHQHRCFSCLQCKEQGMLTWLTSSVTCLDQIETSHREITVGWMSVFQNRHLNPVGCPNYSGFNGSTDVNPIDSRLYSFGDQLVGLSFTQQHGLANMTISLPASFSKLSKQM